jgi:hypothetical protein
MMTPGHADEAANFACKAIVNVADGPRARQSTSWRTSVILRKMLPQHRGNLPGEPTRPHHFNHNSVLRLDPVDDAVISKLMLPKVGE